MAKSRRTQTKPILTAIAKAAKAFTDALHKKAAKHG